MPGGNVSGQSSRDQPFLGSSARGSGPIEARPATRWLVTARREPAPSAARRGWGQPQGARHLVPAPRLQDCGTAGSRIGEDRLVGGHHDPLARRRIRIENPADEVVGRSGPRPGRSHFEPGGDDLDVDGPVEDEEGRAAQSGGHRGHVGHDLVAPVTAGTRPTPRAEKVVAVDEEGQIPTRRRKRPLRSSSFFRTTASSSPASKKMPSQKVQRSMVTPSIASSFMS